MNDEASSEAAKLDSNHGDIYPSLGAGLGGFVIAHPSALTHQPAEGSLHDPAAGEDFEAGRVIGTFDHFDREFGAEALDPLSEGCAGIATIHPQNPQPGEPAQHAAQKYLGSVALGAAGRGHGYAEHQPQSI